MNDQPFHVEYPGNDNGCDFVVGDIHGELDELMAQLDSQRFDFDLDRLFSVGDLIDRGPKSAEMIILAREPWFIPVQGNHEYMMLEAIATGRFDLWFLNGGDWILDCPTESWEGLVDTVSHWPMAITIAHKCGKRVGICHAEPPVDNWDDISQVEYDEIAGHNMIWGRSRLLSEDRRVVHGVDWVFCGHTPIGGPTILGNTVFIDTGAFLEDGYLTVLNIDEFLETGTLPKTLPDSLSSWDWRLR